MRRSRRLAGVLTVSLLLAGALPIAAQETEVRPGVRVRLEAPGVVAGRLTGTVLARDSASLRVSSQNLAPLDVPFDRITRLEVSRGSSRGAGAARGMLWGGGLGLVTGLLVANSGGSCSVNCRSDQPGPGSFVLMNVFGGLLWGAGIGAIVGREEWEGFTIAPRTGLDPRHERFIVGLTLVR